MVTDPKLAEHLAHWGINILQMEKTEKTMTELQIEKNIEFEANRITEEGESLMPLHGPGCVARREKAWEKAAWGRGRGRRQAVHGAVLTRRLHRGREDPFLRVCVRACFAPRSFSSFSLFFCLFAPPSSACSGSGPRLERSRGLRRGGSATRCLPFPSPVEPSQVHRTGQPGQQLLHEQRPAGALVAQGDW